MHCWIHLSPVCPTHYTCWHKTTELSICAGGVPGERTVLAEWAGQHFRRDKEDRTDCNEKRRKEKVRVCAEIRNIG